MAVATYTKTGNKSTTAAKLDKKVFGVEIKNQDLLKQSYLAYLANNRQNSAVTKKRGEVRGGGKKPWRQKGTGRARFGSIRTPLWRGGGIIFGPTGQENYSIKLSTRSKRLALRQALSLASESNKIKVVETFSAMESKTKEMVKFLTKLEAQGNVLCVVDSADASKEHATQNIPNLRVVGAKYLTVYDILNANSIIISQKSLSIISEWLVAGDKIKVEPKMASGSKA